MKVTPIYLPTSPNEISGEQQNRMNSNLPSETSHPNEDEEITNDMQQKREIKQESDDLQQRQSSDTRNDVSPSHEEERTLSCKNENDSDIIMQKPSPNPCNPDDQRAVENLQPRPNPETGYCSSQSDQVLYSMSVSESFSTIPKEKPAVDARNHALVKMEVSENLVNTSSSSIGMPVTQSDPGKFSYSAKFEKVEKLQPRRNPEPVSQSDVENTPSRVGEKGSDDGYNWRKYGQKLVKGNMFTRSYYRCTYFNCPAKKQVEKSHDGSKTDVNRLGNHHHPKPQNSPQVNSSSEVRMSDTPIVSALKCDTNAEGIIDHDVTSMTPTGTLLLQWTVAKSAEGVIGEVSCSNNDNSNKDAKRLKREITCSDDDNVVNKPLSDSRHVVQTMSPVDLVHDGYRWRKYGQKMVKGSPNPRSYYRCSYAGCPVKKHVERARHDPRLVITTYEGQHYHDIPPCRNVGQSMSTSHHANNIITTNDESRPNPEENSNNNNNNNKQLSICWSSN